MVFADQLHELLLEHVLIHGLITIHLEELTSALAFLYQVQHLVSLYHHSTWQLGLGQMDFVIGRF